MSNKMENTRKWYCPVCGFDLTNSAHGVTGEDTVNDTASVLYTEICPSCGIEFGMGDMLGLDKDKDKDFYRRWRKNWIANKMKWWSKDTKYHPEAKEWNPKEQLKNIPKEFLGPEEKY